MIFDEGYFIMNRFKKGFFYPNDQTADWKVKVVFSDLVENASFSNDETRGCVLTKSIRPMYDAFGRDNMSRYLKKLVEKGLIEIESIGKNKKAGSCIRIKHYEEIQNIRSYFSFSRDSARYIAGDLAENSAVIQQITNSNHREKIQNKKQTQQNIQHTDRQTDRHDSAEPACSYIEKLKELNNGRKNTVTTSDSESHEINFNDPDSLAIAPSKPVKKAKSKKLIPEGKSVETINAYKLAYRAKYGVDPIINATTRGQACKLVDYVGKEAAPLLAKFYLTHHAQWYVRNLHKFGLLLSDAEKLHTEMQKQEYMTETLARKADKQSHEQSVMDEIQRKIESGYFQLDDD
jgi:hypothetical protein